MAKESDATVFVYVGAYTQSEPHVQGKGEGIYVYRMDPKTADLTLAHAIRGPVNPTYLALHPSQRYLYAVNEVNESDGQHGGALDAFSVDPATGALSHLNRQSTRGPGPCYVSVDATGKYALAANYVGGSVAMLPIRSDGRLEPACVFVQHTGSGPNPNSQKGPHAHCIVPDPNNRFVLAADLGTDKIFVYRLDLVDGKLVANEEPWADLATGAGPRHIAFHPNGKFVYVINELDSTLTAFAYDAARGTLERIQCVSTLPSSFAGANYCADLQFAPSGEFLYGSNRGHDSIVIYAVDGATGKADSLDWQSTYGECPRNFAIDPTGRFLLAANQDTDTIVTFRLDNDGGKMIPTGQVTQVPSPVCIKFLSQ